MKTSTIYSLQLVRVYPGGTQFADKPGPLPWTMREAADDGYVSRAFRIPFIFDMDRWGQWYAVAVQFVKR